MTWSTQGKLSLNLYEVEFRLMLRGFGFGVFKCSINLKWMQGLLLVMANWLFENQTNSQPI
jgi:hypothetical protein